MLAELVLIGRRFLALHRHWIGVVFGLECLYLAGMCTAVFGFDLFQRLQSVRSVGLIFAAPVVCAATAWALQLALGIHLGITFSLRDPAAWESRLPVTRPAATRFAYGVFWANALLLYLPAFEVWRVVSTLTAYPGAIALVLSPCVAYQVARRAPNPALAIATASVSTAAVSALMVSPLLLTKIFREFVGYMRPLNFNILVLAFSMILAFMLDTNRKAFRKEILVASLIATMAIGLQVWREYSFTHSEYYARLEATYQQSEQYSVQLKAFEREVEEALECPSKNCGKDILFRNPEELKRAIKVLLMRPEAKHCRQNLDKLLLELPDQPSLLKPMNRLFRITDSCGKGTLTTHELYGKVVRSIGQPSIVSVTERQDLAHAVWNYYLSSLPNSRDIFSLVANAKTLRVFLEERIVEGISMDDLKSIGDEFEKIKARLNSPEAISLLALIGTEGGMPTDSEVRGLARWAFADHSLEATQPMMDQLVSVASRARLRAPD